MLRFSQLLVRLERTFHTFDLLNLHQARYEYHYNYNASERKCKRKKKIRTPLTVLYRSVVISNYYKFKYKTIHLD